MAKSHCKCAEAECECPEWIFTFADLVMLMMGFFVVLWVLKPTPTGGGSGNGNGGVAESTEEHWNQVVAKIRQSFGYIPDAKSNDPIDVLIRDEMQKLKPMAGPGDGGKTRLDQRSPEGTDPQTMTIRPGRYTMLGGHILFDAGKADLTPQAVKQLDQIAQLIRGHLKIVVVKGNTSLDDLPESASAQDRMNLSVKRAQVVADYLTACGVEPQVLRVQGCSTFEPIVQHVYEPGARLVNRRVEVEATESLVADRQGDSTKPTTHTAPVLEPSNKTGD